MFSEVLSDPPTLINGDGVGEECNESEDLCFLLNNSMHASSLGLTDKHGDSCT